MPRFGTRSKLALATCDERLQVVLVAAIKHYDFAILTGHRGEEDQNAAVDAGRSKLRWPDSRHNVLPSLAVDVVPWFDQDPHIQWRNLWEFDRMATYILREASRLGVNLKWGGHWKRFRDYPHFQLEES